MYSGAVAGRVYSRARLPRRLVILGPNHTGLGKPVAIMNRGLWETPLGSALIDETLANLILDVAATAEVDEAAHRAEHSLEVQIPFLQTSHREFMFAPICVGTGRKDELIALGDAIATAARSLAEPVGIVMSTDLTHYEPAASARQKDFLVIRKIESLDSEGLHALVQDEGISMCGAGPVTAGLRALKRMGAASAELISYANSGDTSGDYREVVGYAGLLIR
jgi:AmmeMemoRadiSam system protein B